MHTLSSFINKKSILRKKNNFLYHNSILFSANDYDIALAIFQYAKFLNPLQSSSEPSDELLKYNGISVLGSVAVSITSSKMRVLGSVDFDAITTHNSN